MHAIQMFDRSVRQNRGRIAFTGAGGSFTYLETQKLSNQIANALLKLNLIDNPRFAIFSPNCSQAMIASLGASRAGFIWCNLNARNALIDNIDILNRGDCKVLFFHSCFTDLIPEFLEGAPSIKHAYCIDQTTADFPDLNSSIATESETAPDMEYPASAYGFQGATGGTTGKPKLALSTHSWTAMSVIGWTTVLHYDKPAVNLCVTPITHAAGIVCLAHLAMGATNIFMDAPSLEGILEHIEKDKVTTVFLPPTVIYMLLNHPMAKTTDYSSLKYVIVMASPMAPEKIIEASKVFGPVMAQAYGQTEAGVPLTFISPAETEEAIHNPELNHRLSSCGRQTIIVSDMAIVDEDDQPLGDNEKGEIVLRGPTMMSQYYKDPEATRDAQKNGWHHTGDIGYLDADGFLHICDRKRDLIISGGFNIFPFEVEQAVFEHPAVQDCAVIGRPDEKWGEAVIAVIQAKEVVENPKELEAEIIAYCKEQIGSMKAPKAIIFMDDLPRSPVGKVLKRVLRDTLFKHL